MQYTSHAAAVLAAVEELPACNVTNARHRTGLGRRAFDAAIHELLESGSVHRITAGRDALLLPDQPDIEEFQGHVRVLRDPQAHRLHKHISATEVCSRAEVLNVGRAWGWASHVTRWRLHALEGTGLVQAFVDLQDQRCVLYRGLPAHPTAIETLQRLDMYESKREMATH